MRDKAWRIASLIKKRKQNILTQDENLELDKWLSESGKNKLLFDNLNDPEYVQKSVQEYASSVDHWERFNSPIFTPKKSIRRRIFQYAVAAAVVICLFSICAYLYLQPQRQAPAITQTETPTQDVQPGGQRATLILADNTTVNLTDIPRGVIAKQGETAITKTSDGNLRYEGSGSPGTNVLRTPRGGYYHLIFSDGSKVWLNAESTLRYPATFTGKQRKVELTGEAYFIVAKNKNMPFIVQTRNVEVEVLGTRFNVQSYDNEENIATTLIEGSVSVSAKNEKNISRNQTILKPSQQAIVEKNQELIKAASVEADEFISWVNGSFYFNNATLPEVMRQLTRWFDMEVAYSPGVAMDKTFKGSIERNIPLSKVLSQLSRMGNFEYAIKDNTILIKKAAVD